MAGNNLSGKLAVILHADVVGSTALVQRDEQRTHQRIQGAFQRFGRTISSYHGQVRELRGDALLAEFERASDAVSAALAFQSDQAIYNTQLVDDILPVVRIGVALGEVIIADNTITGQGVVLAQRLEQLSDPGGLCITPAIREALPKRLPFNLESLGAQNLKGFEEAVGIYRVTLQDGATVPIPTRYRRDRSPRISNSSRVAVAILLLLISAAAAFGYFTWLPRPAVESPESVLQVPDRRPSIAVLPFENLSGDPDQEYFADGITEDLTTDLSRITGLFVVARNSSFAYKGQSVDVRSVARDLGVRYILEGSVRRSARHIRINAQLIDGDNGGHVWAERFDGTMADVFALQDHVNRKIVAALEVNLTASEEQRLKRVETNSPEAYDVLLRGIEQYNLFTKQAINQARDLFKQAVVLDPGYARAYANIALTHAVQVNFLWADDRDEAIRTGLEFAEKASNLDSSLPQIYQTRSLLYLAQRKYQAAIEAARRTIEVHPNYADGYATLGATLVNAAEFDAAIDALTQAMLINPQGTSVYLGIKGRALFLTGRYEDALTTLGKALERNPAIDRTHLYLAASYAELDRLEEAAWSASEALMISPDTTLSKQRREINYMREADIEHFIDALRKAGIPEQ